MIYKDAYETAVSAFDSAGIENPASDAFWLLDAAAGINRLNYLLKKNDEFPSAALKVFDGMVRRRLTREPCQYITGNTEFMGLRFKVNRSVLIPRPDTEILAETAINAVRLRLAGFKSPDPAKDLVNEGETRINRKIKILDLCTGSGAIAVSLAKFLSDEAEVFASDISPAALALAKDNAMKNGIDVKFFEGDLFDFNPSVRTLSTSPFRRGDLSVGDSSSEASTLDEPVMFDIIVCNPPYVSESEYKNLAPEIRDFEPESALLAGEDGLDFYRRIAADAASYLNVGGMLLLEIGSLQAENVSELLRGAGFTNIECIKDLAGLDRVIKCSIN